MTVLTCPEESGATVPTNAIIHNKFDMLQHVSPLSQISHDLPTSSAEDGQLDVDWLDPDGFARGGDLHRDSPGRHIDRHDSAERAVQLGPRGQPTESDRLPHLETTKSWI